METQNSGDKGTRFPDHQSMNRPLIRHMFESVSEYLEFLRSGREIRKSTADGWCVATLKKVDGNVFQYHLTAGPIGSIYERIYHFRATEEILALFHAGCSKVADRMAAYFETGDMEEFEHLDNFEQLESGQTGQVWLDLVDDEELQQCLHAYYGHRQDKSYAEATKSLVAIPRKFDEHPEVMRLRLLHSEFPPGTFTLEQLAVWARKLVDLEPYDPLNWQVLADIVRLEDPQAAVEVFYEALQHHEEDFVLLYCLTHLLCDLGRFDEARDPLRRSLQVGPCCRESAWDCPRLAEIWDVLDEEPSLPGSGQ
jgi:tetratricopeptide (TPR) repeat protein